MEFLGKRLIEVECVLNRMDEKYVKKIPQEFLNFMNENKDINYNFKYDDNKSIIENNLHLDSIALLTYININFLLDSKSKKEMVELLKEDALIYEEEKRKRNNPDSIFKNGKKSREKYNTDNLFQNRNNIIKNNIIISDETAMVEYKEQKWYQKLFAKILKVFRKN